MQICNVFRKLFPFPHNDLSFKEKTKHAEAVLIILLNLSVNIPKHTKIVSLTQTVCRGIHNMSYKLLWE